MGNPDEINDTYEPIISKRAQKLGFSYVYLIQRETNNGSVNEKNEILVRLQFDLKEILLRIDSVGIHKKQGSQQGAGGHTTPHPAGSEHHP